MRAYPILVPRETCPKDSQYYTCASPSFAGCCSIDPCKTPPCPDSEEDQQPTTSGKPASSSTHKLVTMTVTESDNTMTSTISDTPEITSETITTKTGNPTNTATSTSTSAPTKDAPVSTGAIVGGIVGGVALLAILAGLFFLWRARRQGSAIHPTSSNAPAAVTPNTATSEHWPYPSPHPHSQEGFKVGGGGSRGPSVDLHAHPAYVELPTSEHTEAAELPSQTSPVEGRGGGGYPGSSPLAREVQYEEEFGGGQAAGYGHRSNLSAGHHDMEMQPHSPLLERGTQQ